MRTLPMFSTVGKNNHCIRNLLLPGLFSEIFCIISAYTNVKHEHEKRKYKGKTIAEKGRSD
jgi:hypothetical protein